MVVVVVVVVVVVGIGSSTRGAWRGEFRSVLMATPEWTGIQEAGPTIPPEACLLSIFGRGIHPMGLGQAPPPTSNVAGGGT